MTRRVVVTGFGVISAFGDDGESFWQDCLAGRTVVAPIPDAWRSFADYRSCIWSPLALPDFSLSFSRVERSQHDAVTLMTCAAAARALQSAGLASTLVDRRSNQRVLDGVDATRFGVFVGTGVGGTNSFMVNHAQHVLANAREQLSGVRARTDDPELAGELDALLQRMIHAPRFNPFVVSMLMANAPAAYLGIKYGLRGPNAASVQACASGTVAIGRAFESIVRGEADHALAGGSEYLDDPHGSIFLGFDVCRALVRNCDPPEEANRPFDAARSGFLFAQGGSAMLVLENAEHAARRGAKVLAEVVAFSESFDAHSMMNPEPHGSEMEDMLRRLLNQAGISPGQVDYVNAHGTGTQNNDACESALIARVFGPGVAVNATKSLLGHTIGASGAFEAVVTALSLRDQVLHPCRNLTDPIAELDFITRAERRDLRLAVSQSFAFGGHNAALLMACPGR